MTWEPAGQGAGEPLPRALHSEHDEGPFQRCSDCGAPLQEPEAVHIIGKCWRDGEVVFEYALCFGCALSLYSLYSEESKTNLEAYFQPQPGVSPAGLASCFRCGASGASLAEEKSIEAVGIGNTLLLAPVLVCGPCTDGAEKVLSKKTKEAFDDFVRRVCPTLPADVDIPAPVFALP